MKRVFHFLRLVSLFGFAIAAPALAVQNPASPQPALDPDAPTIDRQKVHAAFDQLAATATAGKWAAQWDDKTGLPRMLQFGVSRAYPGAASDAADAFVQENLSLFAVDRDGTTLRVASVKETIPTIKRVFVEQNYRGLHVVYGAMVLAVDGQNRISFVNSTIWPISPQTNIQPALTSAQALERGQATLPEFDGDWETPALAIYPRNDGVLAYLLSRRLSDGHVLPWELAIDATTGEMLEQRSVIQHAEKHDRSKAPTSQPKTSGSAPAPKSPRIDNRSQRSIIQSKAPSETPVASFGPIGPCDQTWVTSGPAGQTVIEAMPGVPDPYKVVIAVGAGNFGSPEDATQAEAVYGAGIKLLPGIEYTITFTWSLNTWDSYNAAFGYWDTFFIHMNSEGFYWSHPFGLPDHIAANSCTTSFNPYNDDMAGPVWAFGGDEHSDGDLCTHSGSFSFTYLETDHEKTVYLSAGLDTLVTGAVDGLMPSWGTFELEITGETMIFDPNPIAALNVPILEDMGDSNAAVPTIAYDVVTLTNLTTPAVGVPWKLEGEYAKLTPKPTPPAAPGQPPHVHIDFTPPFSSTEVFPYLRDCHGFEAVMTYHHITANQLYIQSLGIGDINKRQIEIDAHNLSNDNSFYVSSPAGAGFLVFGDGGVDDGEDADVIVHEYGHSIQDNQSPGAYFGSNNPTGKVNETRALGEAFGDYWACSFYKFQNLASGFDPSRFAEWDARGFGAPYLRILNNPRIYPRDIVPSPPVPPPGLPSPEGNYHLTGEIWSGAMWDIQTMLGRTYTDKLALKSNYWTAPFKPNFCDSAQAVLAADLFMNGPANQIPLVMKFIVRGIFRKLDVESAGSGASITISHADVIGGLGGAAPFPRAYRHGQVLTLTAPASHMGRAFRHWRLDGVNQTAGALGVTFTMNDPAAPTIQLTRTARAVYTYVGDITGEGIVNVNDLLMVINAWGACPAPCPPSCAADVTGDCNVNVNDLLAVINNWTGG